MAATAPLPAPPKTYQPRAPAPVRSKVPRKIELADLTPNNIGQLRKLNSVLFPVRFSDKWYKEVLEEEGKDLCKFALFNDIPVGNVCCRLDREGKDKAKLYIMTLGCLAPYRRLGIASALLDHVLQHAGPGKSITVIDKNAPVPKPKKGKDGKEIKPEPKREERIVISVFLHVQTGNEDAKAFYEKHGFQEKEMVKDYYKQGIEPRSAWLLERSQ